MRYPRYRYQVGGAATSKESNNVGPITNNNIRDYENNDWTAAWIIQSNNLASPSGSKDDFIKERIKIIRKKTQKRKQAEKLSSVTGVKPLSNKSKGLGNLFREGVLKGAKAYDTFSRTMRKGSDYLFGRRRRGYGSGFGFGFGKGSSSSGSSSKTEMELRYEEQLAKLRAQAQQGITATGQVYDSKGNLIVESGKDCNLDKECGVLFCKINPVSGRERPKGKCRTRKCNIYARKNQCGPMHLCLPSNPGHEYYPWEKNKAVKDLKISSDGKTFKFSKKLESEYLEISNLKLKIFDRYRESFEGPTVDKIRTAINKIIVKDGEEIKKMYQESKQNLENEKKRINKRIDALEINGSDKKIITTIYEDFQKLSAEVEKIEKKLNNALEKANKQKKKQGGGGRKKKITYPRNNEAKILQVGGSAESYSELAEEMQATPEQMQHIEQLMENPGITKALNKLARPMGTVTAGIGELGALEGANVNIATLGNPAENERPARTQQQAAEEFAAFETGGRLVRNPQPGQYPGSGGLQLVDTERLDPRVLVKSREHSPGTRLSRDLSAHRNLQESRTPPLRPPRAVDKKQERKKKKKGKNKKSKTQKSPKANATSSSQIAYTYGGNIAGARKFMPQQGLTPLGRLTEPSNLEGSLGLSLGMFEPISGLSDEGGETESFIMRRGPAQRTTEHSSTALTTWKGAAASGSGYASETLEGSFFPSEAERMLANHNTSGPSMWSPNNFSFKKIQQLQKKLREGGPLTTEEHQLLSSADPLKTVEQPRELQYPSTAKLQNPLTAELQNPLIKPTHFYPRESDFDRKPFVIKPSSNATQKASNVSQPAAGMTSTSLDVDSRILSTSDDLESDGDPWNDLPTVHDGNSNVLGENNAMNEPPPPFEDTSVVNTSELFTGASKPPLISQKKTPEEMLNQKLNLLQRQQKYLKRCKKFIEFFENYINNKHKNPSLPIINQKYHSKFIKLINNLDENDYRDPKDSNKLKKGFCQSVFLNKKDTDIFDQIKFGVIKVDEISGYPYYDFLQGLGNTNYIELTNNFCDYPETPAQQLNYLQGGFVNVVKKESITCIYLKIFILFKKFLDISQKSHRLIGGAPQFGGANTDNNSPDNEETNKNSEEEQKKIDKLDQKHAQFLHLNLELEGLKDQDSESEYLKKNYKYFVDKKNELFNIDIDERSLRENIGEIYQIYEIKERDIFKPQNILIQYQANLENNANMTLYFYELYKKQEQIAEKKRDNAILNVDLSKIQPLIYFFTKMKFNNNKTIRETNVGKYFSIIFYPLAFILDKITQLVTGLVLTIVTIIMNKLLYPFRKIGDLFNPSLSRQDRFCEILYFLSYLKHCNQTERQQIMESLDGTYKILKKKNTFLDKIIDTSRSFKVSRMYKILTYKKNIEDGYDKYASTFNKKDLMKYLLITHYHYPNTFLRTEIKNIDLPLDEKQKIVNTFYENYGIKPDEEDNQGFDFKLDKDYGKTHYENNLKECDPEKNISFLFKKKEPLIKFEELMKVFDLNDPSSIFMDFYHMNMRFNVFYQEMKKNLGDSKDVEIELTESQSKLFRYITKRKVIFRRQIPVILQEDIRRIYGMNEECGMMKRYLFALLNVIQYNYNISFADSDYTPDINQGGGGKNKTLQKGGARRILNPGRINVSNQPEPYQLPGFHVASPHFYANFTPYSPLSESQQQTAQYEYQSNEILPAPFVVNINGETSNYDLGPPAPPPRSSTHTNTQNRLAYATRTPIFTPFILAQTPTTPDTARFGYLDLPANEEYLQPAPYLDLFDPSQPTIPENIDFTSPTTPSYENIEEQDAPSLSDLTNNDFIEKIIPVGLKHPYNFNFGLANDEITIGASKKITACIVIFVLEGNNQSVFRNKEFAKQDKYLEPGDIIYKLKGKGGSSRTEEQSIILNCAKFQNEKFEILVEQGVDMPGYVPMSPGPAAASISPSADPDVEFKFTILKHQGYQVDDELNPTQTNFSDYNSKEKKANQIYELTGDALNDFMEDGLLVSYLIGETTTIYLLAIRRDEFTQQPQIECKIIKINQETENQKEKQIIGIINESQVSGTYKICYNYNKELVNLLNQLDVDKKPNKLYVLRKPKENTLTFKNNDFMDIINIFEYCSDFNLSQVVQNNQVSYSAAAAEGQGVYAIKNISTFFDNLNESYETKTRYNPATFNAFLIAIYQQINKCRDTIRKNFTTPQQPSLESLELTQKQESRDLTQTPENNNNLFIPNNNQANKQYKFKTQINHSEKKLIKKLISQESKKFSKKNKIVLLGILKSNNPALFRLDFDPKDAASGDKYKPEDIQQAYQKLFQIYEKFLNEDMYDTERKAEFRKLFYNNLLSFLEFLIKIKEVGSLLFEIKESNGIFKLNIKYNPRLEEGIKRVEKIKVTEENILDLSQQIEKKKTKNSDYETYITNLCKIGTAYVKKNVLDLRDNSFVNKKYEIETDYFKKNFFNFLKFHIPTVFFESEFERLTDISNFEIYQKYIRDLKDSLITKLALNFSSANNLNFGKINKIFDCIDFTAFGKIKQIYKQDFQTNTYSVTDLKEEKTKIIDFFINYINNNLELQQKDKIPDINFKNKITNILDKIQENFKQIDTSIDKIPKSLQGGGIKLQDGGGEQDKNKKKKEKKGSKKGENKKELNQKKLMGLCYPKFANCKRFPKKPHFALEKIRKFNMDSDSDIFKSKAYLDFKKKNKNQNISESYQKAEDIIQALAKLFGKTYSSASASDELKNELIEQKKQFQETEIKDFLDVISEILKFDNIIFGIFAYLYKSYLIEAHKKKVQGPTTVDSLDRNYEKAVIGQYKKKKPNELNDIMAKFITSKGDVKPHWLDIVLPNTSSDDSNEILNKFFENAAAGSATVARVAGSPGVNYAATGAAGAAVPAAPAAISPGNNANPAASVPVPEPDATSPPSRAKPAATSAEPAAAHRATISAASPDTGVATSAAGDANIAPIGGGRKQITRKNIQHRKNKSSLKKQRGGAQQKNFSDIPKSNKTNFYTPQEIYDLYLKIKFLKTQSETQKKNTLSLEMCDEFEIRNKSKNIDINIQENYVFEDFIFYQYTIYDIIKKNINTGMRDLVNKFKILTEKFKTYSETPLNNYEIDGISGFQQTNDVAPQYLQNSNTSSIRYETIIDEIENNFKNPKLLSEYNILASSPNKVPSLTLMTKSHILELDSDTLPIFSKESEAMIKDSQGNECYYYVKFFKQKLYISNIKTFEILKEIITNQNKDTNQNKLTGLDIALLSQPIFFAKKPSKATTQGASSTHKATDAQNIDYENEENIDINLYDLIFLSPENIYLKLYTKEFYQIKFQEIKKKIEAFDEDQKIIFINKIKKKGKQNQQSSSGSSTPVVGEILTTRDQVTKELQERLGIIQQSSRGSAANPTYAIRPGAGGGGGSGSDRGSGRRASAGPGSLAGAALQQDRTAVTNAIYGQEIIGGGKILITGGKQKKKHRFKQKGGNSISITKAYEELVKDFSPTKNSLTIKFPSDKSISIYLDEELKMIDIMFILAFVKVNDNSTTPIDGANGHLNLCLLYLIQDIIDEKDVFQNLKGIYNILFNKDKDIYERVIFPEKIQSINTTLQEVGLLKLGQIKIYEDKNQITYQEIKDNLQIDGEILSIFEASSIEVMREQKIQMKTNIIDNIIEDNLKVINIANTNYDNQEYTCLARLADTIYYGKSKTKNKKRITEKMSGTIILDEPIRIILYKLFNRLRNQYNFIIKQEARTNQSSENGILSGLADLKEMMKTEELDFQKFKNIYQKIKSQLRKDVKEIKKIPDSPSSEPETPSSETQRLNKYKQSEYLEVKLVDAITSTLKLIDEEISLLNLNLEKIAQNVTYKCKGCNKKITNDQRGSLFSFCHSCKSINLNKNYLDLLITTLQNKNKISLNIHKKLEEFKYQNTVEKLNYDLDTKFQNLDLAFSINQEKFFNNTKNPNDDDNLDKQLEGGARKINKNTKKTNKRFRNHKNTHSHKTSKKKKKAKRGQVGGDPSAANPETLRYKFYYTTFGKSQKKREESINQLQTDIIINTDSRHMLLIRELNYLINYIPQNEIDSEVNLNKESKQGQTKFDFHITKISLFLLEFEELETQQKKTPDQLALIDLIIQLKQALQNKNFIEEKIELKKKEIQTSFSKERTNYYRKKQHTTQETVIGGNSGGQSVNTSVGEPSGIAGRGTRVAAEGNTTTPESDPAPAQENKLEDYVELLLSLNTGLSQELMLKMVDNLPRNIKTEITNYIKNIQPNYKITLGQEQLIDNSNIKVKTNPTTEADLFSKKYTELVLIEYNNNQIYVVIPKNQATPSQFSATPGNEMSNTITLINVTHIQDAQQPDQTYPTVEQLLKFKPVIIQEEIPPEADDVSIQSTERKIISNVISNIQTSNIASMNSETHLVNITNKGELQNKIKQALFPTTPTINTLGDMFKYLKFADNFELDFTETRR